MKSKDNNYRILEAILYNVPRLKIEIENLKIDLEEEQSRCKILGTSNNIKPSTPTNAFSSPVENALVDNAHKIKYEIETKERKLRKIENNLSLLREDEKMLIDMKYFCRYTDLQICDILNLSISGLNKRKRTILVNKLLKLDW